MDHVYILGDQGGDMNHVYIPVGPGCRKIDHVYIPGGPGWRKMDLPVSFYAVSKFWYNIMSSFRTKNEKD